MLFTDVAGFLDQKTRIMDVVLTGIGRKLLSQKELRFCYWSAFDDEVDYDPFIYESGSLGEQDLESKKIELIESALIREPVSGYTRGNRSLDDCTNVHLPLFSKQQGKEDLPRVLFPQLTGSTVFVKQRGILQVPNTVDERGRLEATPDIVKLGYERLDASSVVHEISFSKDGFSQDFVPDGFFVRFFKSGSEGLEEISPKRDSENDLSIDRDLKVFTGNRNR